MSSVFFRVRSGEVAGNVAAHQLPDVPCNKVMIKALGDNAGVVAIGGTGVTLPAGTTDTTSGIPLKASEETPWIEVDNLNRLYAISENAGDDLAYLAIG